MGISFQFNERTKKKQFLFFLFSNRIGFLKKKLKTFRIIGFQFQNLKSIMILIRLKMFDEINPQLSFVT